MSKLEEVIAKILALEAAAAAKEEGESDSKPGAPATEAAIAAAEASRGVTFPAPYRAFLALHDGWAHFSWGTSLYSTAQLTGDGYNRGYIVEMEGEDDELLTDEVRKAVVIGASENDASLVLLCADGSIMDWRYEEEGRFKDFDAYLADRLKTLRGMASEAEETEKEIERDWDPKTRANADAAVAKDVRKVLAKAKPLPPAKPPKALAKKPVAVKASTLVVKRGKEIAAEVTQHLVLYLGAYPAKSEVLAAFRAWRKHFPIQAKLEWMLAGGMFMTTSSEGPDAEPFADKLRVDNGHYGLRASIDTKRDGRAVKYVLNVRGVPPTSDALPRASFCEVIVPGSESPAALHALARDLLAALPVRSGHGGFAAYVWDDDAEPDPNADVFDWCRRFFAIEIGSVDGWLPGALKRIRGAGWLTILGPVFTDELARTKRLTFGKGITVERSEHGAIIRAGAEPTLGDVQRGEFPAQIAEVERAIEPLAMRHYDQRGWVSFGGTMFTTLTEDLMPFRSHRSTQAYLARLIDPAGFLAPTAREQGDALLRKLTTKENKQYLTAWDKDVKTGFPDFGALMGHLYNVTCSQAFKDDAIAALELAAQHEEGFPKHVMNNLLFGHLTRFLKHKKKLDRALEVMPKALTFAKENPAILHNAACIFARAGKLDRAMQCVLDAKKYKYPEMRKLLEDDDLVPLRTRPAFKKLVAATKPA